MRRASIAVDFDVRTDHDALIVARDLRAWLAKAEPAGLRAEVTVIDPGEQP